MLIKILIVGGTITVASAYLYAKYLYQSLAQRVLHEMVDASSRKAAREAGELTWIPADLLERPEDFRIIHEKDAKSLALSIALRNDQLEEMFTKLLRRNMSCFARMPQSWILWLLARTSEQRESFLQSHIMSIDYREGDLFCGFYRVAKRTSTKIEMNMELPRGAGAVGGMLMISISCRGEEHILTTETLQWTQIGSGVTLPLERVPFRFMHEVASWWLLVSGARYLQDLESTQV